MSTITITLPPVTILNNRTLQNVFEPTAKEWESTEQANLAVIESGKAKVLFHQIITAIDEAEELICLQSFLIQDTALIDALVQAAKRGVRIYVLDAAESRLKDSYEEEERVPEKDYKKMLKDKFSYNFVHRQADFFHGKYILIDPKQTSGKACLFTGNFNEKPFEENPELGVWLSPNQVQELYQVFVYHFWEYATDEQTADDRFARLKPLDKFAPPQLSEILLTSPNTTICSLKSTLLEAVLSAKKEIVLSTFGLDVNHEVVQAIQKKMKAGLKVTIFCRDRQKTIEGHISELQKAGAQVYCHKLIHAKSLLIDQQQAFIFSANFEQHGLDEGLEVGVKLSSEQVSDLMLIYEEWKRTFPYQFYAKKSLQELNQSYGVLTGERGKLKNYPIEDIQRKKESQKVRKVSDLFKQVEKQPIPSAATKVLEFTKMYNITSLPQSDYIVKQELAPSVQLVERKKGKNKKENVILILDSIEGVDLSIFHQYKTLAIYGQQK